MHKLHPSTWPACRPSRRGSPAMKPREWEMLEPRLKAAFGTPLMIQNWREKLPKELLDEIEGAARGDD